MPRRSWRRSWALSRSPSTSATTDWWGVELIIARIGRLIDWRLLSSFVHLNEFPPLIDWLIRWFRDVSMHWLIDWLIDFTGDFSITHTSNVASNGQSCWLQFVSLWIQVNFGNTCYCNSVLQALYFCRPFREKVLQYRLTNKRSKENLLGCLSDLYFNIVSQKKKLGTIAPKKFIARLRKENDTFDNFMQQDAHEFLNYLLNYIADMLQAEKLALQNGNSPTANGNALNGKVRSSKSRAIFQLVNSESIDWWLDWLIDWLIVRFSWAWPLPPVLKILFSKCSSRRPEHSKMIFQPEKSKLTELWRFLFPVNQSINRRTSFICMLTAGVRQVNGRSTDWLIDW